MYVYSVIIIILKLGSIGSVQKKIKLPQPSPKKQYNFPDILKMFSECLLSINRIKFM